MLIIPAIDIREGQVVRLVQGNFDQETVYSHDPLEVARRWKEEGAEFLHIVDLDGAREGKPRNLKWVEKIAQQVSTPIQMGGGIRSLEVIEEVFKRGVQRVVMGTEAVESPDLIREACEEYGEKIAVGIDAQDGLVAIRGWTSSTSRKAVTLARRMEGLGVRTIIFTDIKSDGMLNGPNVRGLKELLEATSVSLIASGGVSNLDDVKKLKELEKDGLQGVIIGKALYTGGVNLKEAIAIAKDENCRPHSRFQ